MDREAKVTYRIGETIVFAGGVIWLLYISTVILFGYEAYFWLKHDEWPRAYFLVSKITTPEDFGWLNCWSGALWTLKHIPLSVLLVASGVLISAVMNTVAYIFMKI